MTNGSKGDENRGSCMAPCPASDCRSLVAPEQQSMLSARINRPHGWCRNQTWLRGQASQQSVWPHSQGSHTLRLAESEHCLVWWKPSEQESCLRRASLNGCHLCKGPASLYQNSCANATERNASAHKTDWAQFGSIERSIVSDTRAALHTKKNFSHNWLRSRCCCGRVDSVTALGCVLADLCLIVVS